MGKHLNALEKEFLIRRYKEIGNVKMADYCDTIQVSITSFKKWLDIYNSEGIEGLARGKDRKGNDNSPILPEGIEPTEENYKREILKLRIENERLKKNYIVTTSPNGKKTFIRLKERNS